VEQGLKLDVTFQTDAKFAQGAELAVGAVGDVLVRIDSAVVRRYLVVEVPLPAGVRAFTAPDRVLQRSYDRRTEFRDDRALLYLDYIPAGGISVGFSVLGEHAGRYQIAPAQVYEMYDPRVRARTNSRWFSVAPLGSMHERGRANAW
jgi:uncharacterized protein YfaS (alpha-2-macroglobulin family)